MDDLEEEEEIFRYKAKGEKNKEYDYKLIDFEKKKLATVRDLLNHKYLETVEKLCEWTEISSITMWMIDWITY